MFERFTEQAWQVVVLAQDEARRLKHNSIGTEDLLLGLLREEEGVAAHALDSLGATLDGVRRDVAPVIGEGERVATGRIPFTPRAKKVLELSLVRRWPRGTTTSARSTCCWGSRARTTASRPGSFGISVSTPDGSRTR